MQMDKIYVYVNRTVKSRKVDYEENVRIICQVRPLDLHLIRTGE